MWPEMVHNRTKCPVIARCIAVSLRFLRAWKNCQNLKRSLEQSLQQSVSPELAYEHVRGWGKSSLVKSTQANVFELRTLKRRAQEIVR